MLKIPFKLIVETDLEKWRKKTFWGKEPETIEWIKSFNNSDVFFDVGANIGVYSLFCATIHKGCKVVAFEPDSKNFYRLLDNIRLNNLDSRIDLYRFLIAEKTGQKQFITLSNEIGASGGQMQDTSRVGDDSCYSIDDLIIYSFDFPDPTHIKIDIDGQELKVIQGMRKTLTSQKLKSVLIEIDNDRDEIMSAFIKSGFTIDNQFNKLKNHSRIRRKREGINVENIIFTRINA